MIPLGSDLLNTETNSWKVPPTDIKGASTSSPGQGLDAFLTLKQSNRTYICRFKKLRLFLWHPAAGHAIAPQKIVEKIRLPKVFQSREFDKKTCCTWVWAAKKWQQAGQSCMSHVTQAAGHCGVSAFLAWRSSASPARAPVTSKHEPPEWEGVVTWTWGRALTLSTRPGIGRKCKWPAKLCRRDRCSLKFCTPCSCSEHLGILGCRYLIFWEKLGHKDVDSNERDRGRDRIELEI